MSQASAGTVVAPRSNVAIKDFNGAFVPDELVESRDRLWLVSDGSGKEGCRAGELGISAENVTTYPLARCGINATASGPYLFLETMTADVHTQTYAVHIERFSTTTHRSNLFAGTVAELFLGSDAAHTQLAYVGGWLWFYANLAGHRSSSLLQISPSTGAVVRSYSPVPPIVSAEPFIVGTPGHVWLSGGPGSGATFARVSIAKKRAHSFELSGNYASVYALAGAGANIIFDYLARSSPARAGSFTDHVGRLRADGSLLSTSPNEVVGNLLVDSSGRLYSVGAGTTCANGASVWQIDQQTLRTSLETRLATDGDACLGFSGPRPVAAAAGKIYALYDLQSEALLYRVASTS